MLYPKELNGLNPKYVLQYDENYKAVKKPFVLMDWIDKGIVNYFGFELVEQVVKDLKINYNNIVAPTETNIQTYPLKEKMRAEVYNITMDSEFTRTEKHNIKRYLKVNYQVPNSLSISNVVLECLCRVFPKLTELNKRSIIDETDNFSYGIKALRTSSINLNKLPKEYHNYTIAELLTLETLEREVITNDLKIYTNSGSSIPFSGFLTCLDTTLHVYFGDSVKDLSIEQSYKDTLKYTKSYGNGINNDINRLPETMAYKKLLEIFGK